MTELFVCPSPECEIERPERLTAALDRLRQRGLEQRCLRLSAREASKEELGLVHRSGGGKPPHDMGAGNPSRNLGTWACQP